MNDPPLVASTASTTILEFDEPTPVAVHNAGASSPFLLVGDHAGNRIPRLLNKLGLSDADLSRHIAWDIGIADVGARLADRLGASFIHQVYSRLVIDCNRQTGTPEAIPDVSDGTAIAGNSGLGVSEARARVDEVHTPYHRAIADEIERRDAAGLPTILVALHSFTPVMNSMARPWHVGVLHDRGNNRFALGMIAAFRGCRELVVGDNEPYSMDGTDFTVPFHAYPASLPYVEIEIRQDLLLDEAGIREWAALIQRALKIAYESS
jgi:predicted N-formylglutamate amidohydrolase